MAPLVGALVLVLWLLGGITVHFYHLWLSVVPLLINTFIRVIFYERHPLFLLSLLLFAILLLLLHLFFWAAHYVLLLLFLTTVCCFTCAGGVTGCFKCQLLRT